MNGITISNHCFIIAEAGVNHNGDVKLAYKLVDAAKEAGADAVKFQTFKAGKVVAISAQKAEYQKKATGSQESQFQMIKKLELSFGDFIKLKEYCDKKGIMFLSTPFDYESVDFLENLVPLYKVGSGEIVNLPFLEYIAKKGKPIILSTGMSRLGEVEEAINTIQKLEVGSQNNSQPIPHNSQLILLHCVSNYPANFEEVNLKAILTLKSAFKLPVGYSDHTLGIEIPIAAVALGATVIEKHFTLDRSLSGPDHKASLEPSELKSMVTAIRNVEKSLGDGVKKPTSSEIDVMKVARRSLIAGRNMKAGEKVKESNIVIKRPGTGILPRFREIVVGMKLKKDIEKDEAFDWRHFKK